MGLESMEIYQIHWPFGMVSSRYWDGLADCVEQGLVKVKNHFPLFYALVRRGKAKFNCVERHVGGGEIRALIS